MHLAVTSNLNLLKPRTIKYIDLGILRNRLPTLILQTYYYS